MNTKVIQLEKKGKKKKRSLRRFESWRKDKKLKIETQQNNNNKIESVKELGTIETTPFTLTSPENKKKSKRLSRSHKILLLL